MQLQCNSIRLKRKTILSFIVAILTLGGITPVLAAYLGPNRVVTTTTSVCKIILYECQFVPAKNTWRYKKAGDWSCSLEGKPWLAYPSDPQSQGCSDQNPDDVYWSEEEVLQEVTATYPPASISGALQDCTSNNGWCNTRPNLFLSATEPIAGHNILAIEGILNNQTFGCSGANCSVPLSEGINNFSFWALSSWGDTSEMGTFTTQVDSQLPSISGTLSGTLGASSWYLSPVSFNGSASDTTSGLASFTCTLDGMALPSCNSITVNTAGPHTLVLIARDNAGNSHTIQQNASVDTQNPILNASLNALQGSNNWYTGAVLNATAADPTPGSGLSAFEYNFDNSSWIAFPAAGELTLPEGKHSIDIRAKDNAGRTVATSKSFWLDTKTPDVTINPTGTLGEKTWYITDISLTANASDDTSGLDIFEYSLNNDPWITYTLPLKLSDGAHSISLWAQDKAGLVTQLHRTYLVDTHAPQIGGHISGMPGKNGWYISNVTLSASASDQIPGSSLDTFTYTLNNGAETPYTNSLSLTDGEQIVKLTAKDQAGLTSSTEHTIKVDTMAPSLNIHTALPSWIEDSVTISGSSDDPSNRFGKPGSGLSKVEVSTDGGQTWQATPDLASWNYAWSTTENSDGLHEVHVRAIDNAGWSTEQIFIAGVDNSDPKIRLPDSWCQWDVVTIDIWDNHSGLSEARVEISDPEERWPIRKINLDVESFPMEFKWDRRFGDGTVAPLGTYDLKVLAFDNLGHFARKSASINILLGILPPGSPSTPQPYEREEMAPIPQVTATSLISAAIAQSTIVSSFGATPAPASQANPSEESLLPPRPAPTQVSILDWMQSIFIPDANAGDSVSAVGAGDESNEVAPPASIESNVLWGAAAAAMIGAATAYALDEKRKREEEAEKKRAEIEARIAERAEQKKAAAEAHKVAQWLAGQALLKEKELHALEMGDVTEKEHLAWYAQSTQYQSYQARMADWHEQQAKWKALETADMTSVEKLAQHKSTTTYQEREEALQEYHQEQRARTAETARWEGLASQGEHAANMPEENWWEKTKTFLHDKVAEPLNTSIITPYIAPAFEQTKDAITSAVSWLNENVYTPYILPKVEKVKENLSDSISWVDKQIYQPYVQPVVEMITKEFSDEIAWMNANVYQKYIEPALETTLEQITAGVGWVNANIYQPYLQPLITTINETVYQPYIQPMLEKAKDLVAGATAWVNTNIYQPYLRPVVDDVKDVWAEYGEWVHGALDAAGFVPGLGEIADGLNGLIYLGEGRYMEASISVAAMIPVIGDLGKAGKLTAKVGQELLEEATESIVGELAEGLLEVVAKETLQDVAEVTLKETSEELLERAAQDALEEFAELTPREFIEELTEKTAKELVDNLPAKILNETSEELTEKSIKQVAEKATNEVSSATPSLAPEIFTKSASEPIVEKLTDVSLEEASQETTQLISTLTEKYGKQAVEQFIPFCEKYGINPQDVLTRPPAEGQSLVGWALGIDNLDNPVNHPLQKLDLTDADIEKILKESTFNPDSKVVVLGYGGGAQIPYYKLGEKIKGCFLSLSNAAWAPFDKARANFWTQINAPFLEKSIADRKIFLFNIQSDVVLDPANVQRYSLPEYRLLKAKQNNYVQVTVGEYSAFVPAELLDDYMQYLPTNLSNLGE